MTNLVRIDSQGNIQKLESADFANEVDKQDTVSQRKDA